MSETQSLGAGAPSQPQQDGKPEAKPEAKHPVTTVADLPPEALKQRLDAVRDRAASDARAALLAEIGVTDASEAKRLMAEAQAAADAQKSELEKLTDRANAMSVQLSKAEQAGVALKAYADAELAALSEERSAAVREVAGDDPAAQLRALVAMRKTWAPAKPEATEEPTPQQAPVKPASTTPTTGGPPEAGATTPINHRERFLQLKAKNPYLAAEYLNAHGAAKVFG